jgi:hypothetical protein
MEAEKRRQEETKAPLLEAIMNGRLPPPNS